ncbi:hypothetical protein P692DRAFT_20725181, partial [Suillus brevipes Sb2]
ACRTTVGGERPDELIHLAAAMQFFGFLSVVGSMWRLPDRSCLLFTATWLMFREIRARPL